MSFWYKTVVRLLMSSLMVVLGLLGGHHQSPIVNQSIPDKLFGSGLVYYVDGVTGNNTNPGTSTGAPWATVQKAATTMVAGDTVYIRGNQSYAGSVTTTANGTAGNQIVYTGNWPGEESDAKPIIEGNHDHLDGFDLTLHADYITINNLEIRNFKGHCIDANSYNHAIHDIFTSNSIHDCGIPGMVMFQYGNGIYSPYEQDLLIDGNDIYNVWYNGVNTEGTNVTVTNNYIHDGHRVGIGLGATGTIMIANNTINDWHEETGGVHSDGMQIVRFSDRLGVHSKLFILGNHLRDDLQGIFVEPYSSGTTLGNKLGDDPGGDVVISGNTIVNTYYNQVASEPYLRGWYDCVEIDHGYNDITSVTFDHNIMVNCNGGEGGFTDDDRYGNFHEHFHIGTLIMHNNLFVNSNDNPSDKPNLVQNLITYANIFRQDHRGWFITRCTDNDCLTHAFDDLDQYRTAKPNLERNSFGVVNP